MIQRFTVCPRCESPVEPRDTGNPHEKDPLFYFVCDCGNTFFEEKSKTETEAL